MAKMSMNTFTINVDKPIWVSATRAARMLDITESLFIKEFPYEPVIIGGKKRYVVAEIEKWDQILRGGNETTRLASKLNGSIKRKVHAPVQGSSWEAPLQT